MNEIPGKNIYIEQLKEMFSNIERDTEWDIFGEMLWGYFFTHHEPNKLEEARAILISQGYNYVDIYLSDKDEPSEPDMYWLHIEKVENHTPSSLDNTNNELYLFAHNLGLDSYDGMDVGPVNK